MCGLLLESILSEGNTPALLAPSEITDQDGLWKYFSWLPPPVSVKAICTMLFESTFNDGYFGAPGVYISLGELQVTPLNVMYSR